MKMIITIFKIRLLQLFRLLKGIGLIRIIIVLLILWFLSILIYNFAIVPEDTVKMSIITGLLLFSVHASRKDKHFLKIAFKISYPIYLSEYLLLIIPFFVIWIIHSNWFAAGLLVLIVLLIPLVYVNFRMQYVSSIIKVLINPFKLNLNSKFKIRLPFISTRSFEWISGIRRNLILLVPVYLFILAFSFKPYVAVVGLIFLSILISGFYYYGEPREFIELLANNPIDFILHKIFINLKQLFIVFIPIIIIATVFQTSTWYYLIGAIIISFFIQAFTIVIKYGLFEENARLNRNSIIIFANILFIIVLPAFWPVPLIMGIKYYLKARKNLKKYYHD